MAKTLLQIVKNTLASMDGDDVDTIYLQDGGTEESEQIAMFAEALYEYMYSVNDWPNSKTFTSLEALGDSTKPNYLKIPDRVTEIEWLKYREEDIKWLTPLEFVELCDDRTATDSDVIQVTTFEGNTLNIKNDKHPEYYTSFDNKYLVFDSYKATVQTTLEQSDSTAYCVRKANFQISDTYQVEIPDSLLPLFEAELKREASIRLRQQDSPIDAKRALTGWAKQRTKSDRVNKTRDLGYGRK